MYFAKPGKVNTQQTLERAYQRGRKLGLNEVVLDSSSGETAYQALENFQRFQITFDLRIREIICKPRDF